MYADGVVTEGNVRKWCPLFNLGRTDVHDEERSRRLSLATNDIKNIECKHSGKRRFTFSPLQENFGRPDSEEWPRDKRRSAGLDKRLGGNLFRRMHIEGGPKT